MWGAPLKGQTACASVFSREGWKEKPPRSLMASQATNRGVLRGWGGRCSLFAGHAGEDVRCAWSWRQRASGLSNGGWVTVTLLGCFQAIKWRCFEGYANRGSGQHWGVKLVVCAAVAPPVSILQRHLPTNGREGLPHKPCITMGVFVRGERRSQGPVQGYGCSKTVFSC